MSLFFFNDTATTEIYALSLHDALPISRSCRVCPVSGCGAAPRWMSAVDARPIRKLVKLMGPRSEEHTSELQSQSNLVCRLLLEKKKSSNNLARFTNSTRTVYHTSTLPS